MAKEIDPHSQAGRQPSSDSKKSTSWLQEIGRSRRLALWSTPMLLAGFIATSANSGQFGWGFVPAMALLVLLVLVLVATTVDVVLSSIRWLMARRMGRYDEGARHHHVVMSDLLVFSAFGVALLVLRFA